MEPSLTPAAQVIIALIPIVGIGLAATLVFFVLLWRHHENEMRIAKGLDSARPFNLRVFSLLTGLCLIGVGLVLTVMFLMLEGLAWALLGGLIPLVLGVMLIVFYIINPESRAEP